MIGGCGKKSSKYVSKDSLKTNFSKAEPAVRMKHGIMDRPFLQWIKMASQ
jgi:hypothetical protein